MRPSLWLILFFAFAVGMGCALVIRALHFEAPRIVQTDEPRMKILVATRTIPGGVEITADFVAFQEVVSAEIPIGACSSFTHIYRRQSAYPIPAGCPICEDLLLPLIEEVPQTAFIPTGSQLVSLDIVHIRQGDNVFAPKEPIAAMLGAEQRIDIRIVPRNEGHGRLAEMKNAVLQAYAAQEPRNCGEILLENVPIHQIVRRSAPDHTGSPKDSLVLMLGKSDAAKLTAAAKKGKIRILTHPNEQTAQQPEEPETIFEVAEQTQPQDVPLEIPVSLEQPLLVPVEPAPVVAIKHVQKDAPLPGVLDSALPPIVGSTQSLDRLDEPLVSMSSEPRDTEKILIRNESPAASFGTPPRLLSSELPVEQHSVLTGLSRSNEMGRESLIRPLQDTVMGPPRMSQAIKFLSPESVAPLQESPSAITNHSESTLTLPVVSPVPPVMPLIVTSPSAPPEKIKLPGYSPWDRRTYTVQPSEGWGEGSDGELSSPPRLLRDPGVAM